MTRFPIRQPPWESHIFKSGMSTVHGEILRDATYLPNHGPGCVDFSHEFAMRSPRRQNHSRNPTFSVQECRKHINKFTSHPVICKITQGIRHFCRATERKVWNSRMIVTSQSQTRKILRGIRHFCDLLRDAILCKNTR